MRGDKLTAESWKTVRELGIAWPPPTRRGCRTAARKQRRRKCPPEVASVQPANKLRSPAVSTKCKSWLSGAIINARSVRNKTLCIVDHILEHDLDIVALCETWLFGDERDSIVIHESTPDGYQFHHVPRQDGRGYGGVAIIAKSSIHLHIQGQLRYNHLEGMDILADTCKKRTVFYLLPPPPLLQQKTDSHLLGF